MVGVGCSVVVRHVAGAASCGCTRIAVRMALYARRGRVRTVQWEIRGVVVEGGVAPSGLIMACSAISAEA